MSSAEQNPLLQIEFRVPFDRIRAADVEPAAAILLRDARAGLATLASTPGPRTFDNTIAGPGRSHRAARLRHGRGAPPGVAWPPTPNCAPPSTPCSPRSAPSTPASRWTRVCGMASRPTPPRTEAAQLRWRAPPLPAQDHGHVPPPRRRPGPGRQEAAGGDRRRTRRRSPPSSRKTSWIPPTPSNW